MKLISVILIAVSSLMILPSCKTAPKMTSHQRRALQVRTFENNLNTTFKAVKTVLLDEGYIIKNQDMDGGMILAQKETDGDTSGAKFLRVFSGNKNYVTGQGYEVSFNFDKINATTTETRMTLQTTTKTNLGGSSGREIVDPLVYKLLYEKVSVEIGRRKAKAL